MGLIESKLSQMGFTLPEPPLAEGNYLGSKQAAGLLFVSGRKSDLKGAVGADVTKEQAKEAVQNTVLQLLAIVKQDILDLDQVKGVVKLQGFIRSAKGFDGQPFVLDGASELLISLFGDAGRHARTATGVSELPYGATIQLDMILQL
jgi:enamine deaminase RidA (YjgF/YER057c/UK114 family)